MKLAICGCGIGGLACAIYAQRLGFDAHLFDQFDTPAPVGSGLVIQPVGQQVLHDLGAGDAALAKGARTYRLIGEETTTGRRVLDASYGPAQGADFGLGIHRASLFDALLQVATSAGVQIITGHHATASQTQGAGRFVSFANGDRHGPFDLVIDAAGAGSALSPLVGTPLSYGAIWGTVDWPADTALAYDMLQQKYRRASNMIGILPIGTLPGEDRPKAALFWSMPRRDLDGWAQTPVDDWRETATALWPDLRPFTDQITDTAQMTTAAYAHGSLLSPYSDRLVHIGDAAHRASPQLGQGANMALLDAQALMRCLDLCAQGGATPETVNQALTRYARARRLHTMFYQMMSWAFTPMYQSDNRFLPKVRDHVLAPLSRVPPVPAFLSRLVKGNILPPLRGL